MGDQKHSPHEGSVAQTPPSDWKEMLDPKSGKKYWVNHFTKQMSYHPPAASKSPPQPAIDANFKGALGLSRLDELLERYEKITTQNCSMQSAPSGIAASEAQNNEASPPAIIKSGAVRAQRSAAPPSASFVNMTPIAAPSSPSSKLSPAGLFSISSPNQSVNESANQSVDLNQSQPETMAALIRSDRAPDSSIARQNYVRTQANKIPDSVDLLETYVKQPNALRNLQQSVSHKDPYLKLYGLDMFVDNYAPETEIVSETISIEQADRVLAGLNSYLHDNLLRDMDFGSTRQIGGNTNKHSSLVEQAIQAGIAKATLSTPSSPSLTFADFSHPAAMREPLRASTSVPVSLATDYSLYSNVTGVAPSARDTLQPAPALQNPSTVEVEDTPQSGPMDGLAGWMPVEPVMADNALDSDSDNNSNDGDECLM